MGDIADEVFVDRPRFAALMVELISLDEVGVAPGEFAVSERVDVELGLSQRLGLDAFV